MTALTAPRQPPSLATGKDAWTTPTVAANKKIFPGAQVGINTSGYLVPATADPTLKILGVASPTNRQYTRFGPAQTSLGYIDTTDLADGAVECTVHRPIALMANGSSSVTKADVGNDCYAVDDQTVAKTDGGTAQVTRGDFTFNGTDQVGYTVDNWLTISVPSNTSDDQTVADWRDAWNAHPEGKILATASIDTSGAESWGILTFKDSAVHTVVEYSPATAGVTSITNTTAAVAATRPRAGRIHDVESRGVWVEYDGA